MADIYLIGDLHLGHENILKFKDKNGELVRGKVFSDIEEHDRALIDNINSVGTDSDILYIVGDAGFSKRKMDHYLSLIRKKRRRLILGNHDTFDMAFYKHHFQKIRESRTFGSLVITHRPIWMDDHHPKEQWNIHGHIHHHKSPTPRHINVSAETIGYTPIKLTDLIDMYDITGAKGFEK